MLTQRSGSFGRAATAVAIWLAVALGSAAAARRLRRSPSSEKNLPAPQSPFRAGSEIVVVFVTSSTCAFSNSPGVRAALGGIFDSVRAQAARHGDSTVAVVGVAVDWSLRVGLEHLESLGHFDEVIAGRGWLNSGVDRYVRVSSRTLTVPQLIVLRRRVAPNGIHAIQVQDEQPIVVLDGAGAILDWAAHGSHLVL